MRKTWMLPFPRAVLVGLAAACGVAGCARAETPSLHAVPGAPHAPTPAGVVDGDAFDEARDVLPGVDAERRTGPSPGEVPSRGPRGGDVPSQSSQLEPDGNDDPEDPGTGAIPAEARFERVGRPPLALQRICDLTPFHGALYMAHANQPLGTDGATITRYVPDAPKGTSPFKVAFDWNRPGEPTNGGGAGQGFLRAHSIGGRLFVPDADPPYNGFGISEGGTEGFAYHVLDVIRFRGRLYASTGSVPPKERAWRGPSPGALHVANASLSRFTYEVGYPVPYQNGVWRLGFMVRFKDRLYAGIQDYDGREPNDYVVVDPSKDADVITQDDLRGVRVTKSGATQTLRWFTDQGKLYWIGLEKDGAGVLRVTSDGDTWQEVKLPEEAARPTDVQRFRDGLVVLTERALVRIDKDPPEIIARVTGKKSPFEITDSFCAAPLGVLDGELYAGSQRDGSLLHLVTSEPAP
jgi:hypothetical protein